MMIPGMEVRWTTGDWPKPGVFWPGTSSQEGWSDVCGGDGGGRMCISVFFFLLFGRGAGGCSAETQPLRQGQWGAVEEGSEGNGSIMTSLFLLSASRLRGSSLH